MGATPTLYPRRQSDLIPVSAGMRGPEHHAAWCDELAKWREGDAAWDNLMMGLRGGDRLRAVVTTTPRPTRLMRRLMALPDVVDAHLRRVVERPGAPPWPVLARWRKES